MKPAERNLVVLLALLAFLPACTAAQPREAVPAAEPARIEETPEPDQNGAAAAQDAQPQQDPVTGPEAETTPEEKKPEEKPDGALTRKELFDKGNKLFAQGKYRDALRYFQAAAKKGEEAPIFYNIGTAHFRLKQYAEAQAAYKKALELKPDYRLAMRSLGKLYLVTGKDKLALEQLLASLGDVRENAEVLLLVGTLYEKMGDLTAATASLEKAARLAPGSTDTRLTLARVYLASGQKEKALQAFRELVSRSPTDPTLRVYLAGALHGSGKTDEAIDEYETALKLGGATPETYNRLGSLYCAKGMHRSGARYFQKGIDAGDSTASDYLNLAVTCLAAGMYPEATEAARLAARLDPKSARAHRLRGDALAGRGELAGALAAYAKALETDSGYLAAAVAAGRLEYKRKNYEKAIKWYEKALETDSENTGSLRGAGNAAYSLRQYKKAASYYRRLAQLLPGDSSARNFLRHILELAQQEK